MLNEILRCKGSFMRHATYAHTDGAFCLYFAFILCMYLHVSRKIMDEDQSSRTTCNWGRAVLGSVAHNLH